VSGATLDYKLASDPLIFYKNIVNIGDENYAVDASEGVEALMADEKPNGVGYIVLSK